VMNPVRPERPLENRSSSSGNDEARAPIAGTGLRMRGAEDPRTREGGPSSRAARARIPCGST
jgi:hypothetical protein